MLQEGGWGVARLLLILLMAAAVVGGCASDEAISPTAPPIASSQKRPLVPATVDASQPRSSGSASPASLVGLSAVELSTLIGAPRWRRWESPAEVWQYLGASCVLDVYLYADGGSRRVIHAEARDESALPITLSACLQRIEVERRSSAPAS
ncbi:MAG TPA: hypothetical protein VED46_12740 [Alphaproteobacteria bacterium]|nr:hypothetical protein [Alphaproteobacteria bacterium]